MLRAEINLGSCKLLFCSDNTSFLLTEIVMMISTRRSDNFLGLFRRNIALASIHSEVG